jgi:hypothetical protein
VIYVDTAARILMLLVTFASVVVGVLFVWAARRDGKEDWVLQKRLASAAAPASAVKRRRASSSNHLRRAPRSSQGHASGHAGFPSALGG